MDISLNWNQLFAPTKAQQNWFVFDFIEMIKSGTEW